MAVTSHSSTHARIGEVIVTEWKEAGLLKASTIKPILTTIEKRLIIRTLGQLKQPDSLSLRNSLKTILG